MIQKLISYTLAKVKKSRFILNLIEKPINLSAFPVTGKFTDSYNNEFILREGLRSRVKPGWQSYFNQTYSDAAISKEMTKQIAANGRMAVEKVESLVNCFAGGLANKVILEIGCHAGGVTYAFSEKSALKVTGTDYSEYKTSSTTDAREQNVTDYLFNLRSSVRENFPLATVVDFRNDDICNSSLPDNTYDIVCSWDVLEHIHAPEDAFKHIQRILKNGGVTIHTYNPFFCLNGGHSPCTLDFPWAHAVLNAADFERYNNEIQPGRKEKSMSFYKNGLNRMTLKDMKQYFTEAGLRIEAIIPYIKEQHIRMVDARTLTCAKRNYPGLEMEDLVSSQVIIIARKG